MKKTIRQELQSLAETAGGSFKTRANRKTIVDRFATYLKIQNIQIRSVLHIKSSYIESYIQSRRQAGIGKRTLQNEMAALRAVLHQSGREKLADSDSLTNQALNLSGASRKGTKEPISEERFQQILKIALLRDEGMAATLRLSMAMGLRAEEAVQSVKSLKTWNKQIETGKESLRIIFGTKTGKPRDATIHDRNRAHQAINIALSVSKKRGGKLIDKPNLKSAMNKFHNEAKALGMVGKESPHSLRYAYAHDGLKRYQEQGYSQAEALAQVAIDLGHGDGRGRYIKLVYGMDTDED